MGFSQGTEKQVFTNREAFSNTKQKQCFNAGTQKILRESTVLQVLNLVTN
jgi:hypothetical protein